MDIYEYLKLDHQKVADLFNLYETADSAVYKIEILDMISKELFVHAKSEQETFYKFLFKVMDNNQDIVHAQKEHTDIEVKLDEIIKDIKPDANLDKKVLKLKEAVEHHVREEEGTIFKEAKKILTEHDAYVIKEMMHDYKEKIISTL